MKNLMKILSILLAVTAILTLVSTYVNIEGDLLFILLKLNFILVSNILPIIAISLCCFCMERNDTNYLIRVIAFYMCIPIILLTFISFINMGNDITNVISNIVTFMSATYPFVTVLALLLVIKPNNSITRIIRIISFIVIGINVVLAVVIRIQTFMENKLPNVYQYDTYGGFNFTTSDETESLANKVYSGTLIIEGFSIILLFITNYAFSSTIALGVEDIDYETLKKKADDYTAAQMDIMYKEQPKETIEQQSSQPTEKGMMNINNQLGKDSNVGQVEEAAKEIKIAGSSMDDLMPMSSGPVVNETLKNNASQQINNMQQNNTQNQMPMNQTNQPVTNNQVEQNVPQPVQNQVQQGNKFIN